ncbi:SDR family NAD(P)-dependent oxidoreductase [Sphingomonas sp.]|uniref:SDR family NAD(P)-dependent oxidoreductase n=1 Tax=Sphingomonas sp. TaxID=28214 RepID=UPI003B3AC6A9
MGNGKLAIVTGASTGIGFELAHIAAQEGYDLLVVADEPLIEGAAADFRTHGTEVTAIEADLATFEGNDRLIEAANGRPVELLLANAGRGLGRAFVEQDVADWRRVIDTNVTGTTYLIQKVARDMQARGSGRILITGSIAGLMPGSFQAVYNGTKAYLDSFSYALREELRESGVTVTVLMPGATETEFFDRADMLDTKVGTQEKDDAAKVAQDGWDALMSGAGHIVSGWQNKLQAAISHVTPDSLLAKKHRDMAEPGTAENA